MESRRSLALLALCALAGLAACNSDEGQPADTCGAAELWNLVGQSIEAFDAEAREGAVRILPPGSAMTMDHRPDRLNIDTDEDGTITRVWCG